MVRSAQILLDQTDFTGAKILEQKDVRKEAAKAVIPTPLPFSGLMREIPGQNVRQAFSTAGFKVEPSSRQAFLQDKKSQEMFGKNFNDLPIPERLEVARETDKEPVTLQQRYSIAQRATDKEFQRQADIRNALPKDLQAFVAQHGLTISAPEPSYERGRTSVVFNDAEKALLQKKTIEYYTEVLNDVKADPDFKNASQQEKQRWVDHELDRAKRAAKQEVLSTQ